MDWNEMSEIRWDPKNKQAGLTISEDGLVLNWEEKVKAAWLGSQTTGRLASGVYSWDFQIEALKWGQMGVGLLLYPPDWGFYGYLGPGQFAWAYDPKAGAIVTQTKAIHSKLPKFRRRGTVSVELDLSDDPGFMFVVNGVPTPRVKLPARATVIPAACLLKQGQRVRLGNFAVRK